MTNGDARRPEQGRSDRIGGDDLFAKEQELLAKVREVAQQIVERVNKALADTDTHASLPTEEKPALP